MPVTASILVDVLVLAVIALAAIMLEHRFGLRKRTSLIWHKLVNTEAEFKIGAQYDTGLAFDNVTDELKSVIRELYGDMELLDDTKTTLTAEIDDNFLITVTTEDDGISLETSTITSTMRQMTQDMHQILDILQRFEQRNRDQATNTDDDFEDSRFTAELSLPYNSTFVNTYLPQGVTLESYSLELDYPDYDCSITDTGDTITVSTRHRDDLQTVIPRLLRTWSIWWKRME